MLLLGFPGSDGDFFPLCWQWSNNGKQELAGGTPPPERTWMGTLNSLFYGYLALTKMH